VNELPAKKNVKLVIAYNGANYHGWQRQAGGIDTVQQRVEDATARVVGHPVSLHAASRTDAGVHATGQSANFYTTNLAIPLRNLRRAVNSRLPTDIAVRSAVEVPESFHASRSGTGKTYRYRIYVAPQRPVELTGQVCMYPVPLDVPRMQEGGRRLIGAHDFRGFATSSDDRQDTVRTIRRCDVTRDESELHVTVTGDGFLYNMVRNIVGTLMEIGRGRWEPERIDKILTSCDRSDAGPTAPPDGLWLICVHYRPEDLVLSETSKGSDE
jgi:tRNA pseudouridine38-40 synthase